MTIDYASARGQMRLLIPDVVEADFVFTDEQIDAFLSMAEGDVSIATAQALRVIASNSLMLYQVAIRSDDGSIGNAAAMAQQLLARANRLEAGMADIGFDLVGGETYVPQRDVYGYWTCL